MEKYLVLAAVFTLMLANCVSANMVKNGGFESMDGWIASDPALVSLSSDAVEGQSSLKVTSAPNAPEGTESTSVSRIIDIKEFDPQGEYRMQFRIRSDRFPQEYNVFMGLLQGDQWPANIGFEWRQVGPQWQDVQFDFRDVNTVVTAVKLMIQVKAPGSIWIDDLRIVKLPKGTIGAEERLLKDLPKYKGTSEFVKITPDRRFIVKGKPFFPIGAWGLDFPNEKVLRDMRDCGFNLTGTGHLYTKGAEGVKALLDQAQSYGLMVKGVLRFGVRGETPEALAEVERYKETFKPILEVTKSHPAFFAYDIADEPAWIGFNIPAFAEGAHFLRTSDPNHPIFSNQAPRQSIELFKRWYRFVDIGGSDIYPWWNGELDKHSDLPNKTYSVVGDECVKNLKAIGPGKPVVMTIQAFGWSDRERNPQPTDPKGYGYPPQNLQRFMAYDAITSGATGILFFQDMRYADESGNRLNEKVKPVSLELSAIHDVLASATTTTSGVKSLDKRIKLITKKLGKDLYIIAVNTTGESVAANIGIPAAGGTWRVLFEGRNAVQKKNAITETFEPWDVNIYTNCRNQSLLQQFEQKAKCD